MRTHLDDEGNKRMMDFGNTEPTGRSAIAVRGGTKMSRMALAERLVAALESEHTIGIIDRPTGDPRVMEMDWVGYVAPFWNDILIYVGSDDPTMPALHIGEPEFGHTPHLDADREPVIAMIGSAGRLERWPGPRFAADSTMEIAQFLVGYFRRSAPPLFGVVLAGGKSTRMGTDKASIRYHGRPQAEIACELLAGRCDEVYVSIAGVGDGNAMPSRPRTTKGSSVGASKALIDRFIGFGPAGGILTALHERPEAAWLVLGCDLPLMTGADLDQLICQRDPLRPATAFASPQSGLPEPLAAIYEPQMRLRLHAAFASGVPSPRKVLIRTNTRLVMPRRPNAVLNANTPEDRQEIEELISETVV